MKLLMTTVILASVIHFILIAPSLLNIFTHPFSKQQKMQWTLIVLLLPIIGVLVFHRKYRLGWFVEEGYEPGVMSEIARSDTTGAAPLNYKK